MTTNRNASERPEVEDLLPWHAAGTLSRRESDMVETALTKDPELARRFALVREEMVSTIHVNETLGAPSPKAMEKLFAAIEAEPARAPARSLGLGTRIAEFIASLTPRQLAYSAGAAALAIMLQAGLIGTMVIGERSQGTYQTASAEMPAAAGSHALVRFAEDASAGDIAALLNANKVTIVDGPRPGGLYRVRIAALPQEGSVVTRSVDGTTSMEEHRNQVIAKLRAAGNLVRFAVPAQ